jgi:hypothetical protein
LFVWRSNAAAIQASEVLTALIVFSGFALAANSRASASVWYVIQKPLAILFVSIHKLDTV